MSSSEAQSARRSNRGLIALVILLGALIMIGVGALLTGAYLRAGYRAPVAVGGAYRVNLPAPGERIDSAAIDGQRILLRLSGPNGEELVIMDVASGRLIGRVAVNSKP